MLQADDPHILTIFKEMFSWKPQILFIVLFIPFWFYSLQYLEKLTVRISALIFSYF